MPEPREINDGISVKSLVKAMRLLKIFTPTRPEWSFREMIGELGYHKSSVQRLVATLEAEGFLDRTEPHRSRYRLGSQVLFLGNVASQTVDLRRLIHPVLQKLTDVTGETSHLCVVDQSQCYYLDKIDSSRSIRIVTFVGQRLHMHCSGVGKVLLSGMRTEEVDRIIAERGIPRFTPHTVADRKALLDELADIRRRGVAYDREEFEIGLRCLAAPIFNHKGKVVAAISFSGPAQRLTMEVLSGYEDAIREVAREGSEKLGFQRPVPDLSALAGSRNNGCAFHDDSMLSRAQES